MLALAWCTSKPIEAAELGHFTYPKRKSPLDELFDMTFCSGLILPLQRAQFPSDHHPERLGGPLEIIPMSVVQAILALVACATSRWSTLSLRT